MSQQATVETKWYEEWTSGHGKALPEPLRRPTLAAPSSLEPLRRDNAREQLRNGREHRTGPDPNEVKVEYFHVLEKGTKLSGMSLFFTFLDDSTVVTISFGRDAAMLLIVDISGDAHVLDYVALPGRGSKALELAKKSARMAMFRDPQAGPIRTWICERRLRPGADNTVIRIPIRDQEWCATRWSCSTSIEKSRRAAGSMMR